MTLPLTDQIAEVRREIGMRERVYPRWIDSGKMKQGDADGHLARMRAVLETLEALQAERNPKLL